jgi:hypothetical protein
MRRRRPLFQLGQNRLDMTFSLENGLARIGPPRAVLFDFDLIEFVLQKLDQAIAFVAGQFQIHFAHGVLPSFCAFTVRGKRGDSRAKKMAEGPKSAQPSAAMAFGESGRHIPLKLSAAFLARSAGSGFENDH